MQVLILKAETIAEWISLHLMVSIYSSLRLYLIHSGVMDSSDELCFLSLYCNIIEYNKKGLGLMLCDEYACI